MQDKYSLTAPEFGDDYLLSQTPKTYDKISFSKPLPNSAPVKIPVNKLHDFKNHAFQVISDKSMNALIASIKENGIIEPLIVRKDGDEYEIISGHRRREAAFILRLESVPCIVVDYNDEDATLCMCDSNLQREKLLPSERAKYVYLKYHILDKRRKYGDGRKAQLLAEEFGLSENTIYRCLNLYDLGPKLMEAVDRKKLKEKLAADKIHPMRDTTREMIFVAAYEHDVSFDKQFLDIILEADKKEILSQEIFDDIVSRYQNGKKENDKTHNTTMKNPVFPSEIESYFPQSYTSAQIKEKILKLLEQNKDILNKI